MKEGVENNRCRGNDRLWGFCVEDPSDLSGDTEFVFSGGEVPD